MTYYFNNTLHTLKNGRWVPQPKQIPLEYEAYLQAPLKRKPSRLKRLLMPKSGARYELH